jgi:hypothetical protein
LPVLPGLAKTLLRWRPAARLNRRGFQGRYAIVSEQDMKAAGEKLGRLMKAGRTDKDSQTIQEGREQ